jgi:hypothetical protein
MRLEAQNHRGMRATNAEELGHRGLLCDNTIQPKSVSKNPETFVMLSVAKHLNLPTIDEILRYAQNDSMARRRFLDTL